MKPNFALSLSFDGIQLLHRAAGGWRAVGDVALDAADMAAELAVLRRTATALEPGGLRTKLLLPAEQIKYLTIPSDGLDTEARMAAARKALDGATPYPVDDLAFDISADGDQTHVAAVARETLAEAEAFAIEHRFHPTSFATIPADSPYLGEPFFGATKASEDLLEPGEVVEPDGIAVVIIGDAEGQVEDITEETAAAPKDAEADGQDMTDQGGDQTLDLGSEQEERTGEDESDADKDSPLSDENQDTSLDAGETSDAEEAEPAPSDVADDASAPEDEIAVEAAAEPAETKDASIGVDDAVADGEAALGDMSEDEVKDAPEDTETEQETLAADASDEVEPLPATADTETDAAEAGQTAALTDDTAPLADAGSKEADTEAVKEDTDSTASVMTAGVTNPSLPAVGAARRDLPPAPGPSAVPDVSAPAGFASRRGAETGARREPVVSAPNLPDDAPAPPPVGGGAPPAPAVFATAQIASTAPESPTPPAPRDGFLSRRKARVAGAATGPAATANPAVSGSEAQRMTVFGARRDIGGKPRFLGLMLTAALLVFLAGVAAWASVFLDDGLSLSRLFGDRGAREIAAAPEADELLDVPEASITAPGANSDTPQVQTASLSPTLSEEDTAVLDALREPVQPQVSEPNDQEREALYAATGIWPLAPDVPPEPAALISIDDLYLTSIDPVSTANDAVALPGADSFATDVALGKVSVPAAAGTTFALDDQGLVIATVEGALSPDGFTVYLGRPDLVPPPTPTRFQAVPERDPARLALAGVRPKTRPGNLAETNERANLDGLTRSELAGFRPRYRPESVQEQAEAAAAAAAAQAAAEAAVDTDNAVEAALATPEVPNTFENPTRLAIASSIRPDTRPRNFARIVQRAQRTPRAESETRVASVAPRVVTPKIPSSTSVTKQATQRNAINLRKVNLIGVYGKPSSRRALVRLANGRYKKVVVGDRIDGGRVSAIGDSELRYNKRGRNVVLKMPRS